MKIQQWSLPIKSQRRASLAVALLAAFTAAQQPLRAQLTPYTFNWSDEYYCNSLSSYEGVFGGLATGYSSAGIYQAISTTANPTAPSPYYSGETVYASGAVSSTVRLATTGVPGEYVQTSTTGLPSRTEGLALVGWTQSLNPGYQVRNVFNANSTAPYFQYLTGNPLSFLTPSGNQAAFTLNSIDLAGGSTITIQGKDAANNVLDSLQVSLTSALTTYTLNWAGITTLNFSGVNSGDQVTMDNVACNNPVPEPTTMIAGALLLLPFGASTLRNLRRKRGV